MDITPLIGADFQVIQSYGEGRFRVNGALHQSAIIVLPLATFDWGAVGPVEALGATDFAPLVARASEFDVVLLGSGKVSGRPDAALRKALKDQGLNIEYMDTGAACRTYNVLMAEGRRVAAALLPV